MRVRTFLVMATLLAAPLRASADDWRATDLADIGLTDAMRQYTTAPSLRLTFPLRQDRVLTAARVTLSLDEAALPPELRDAELEILVNDILVGRFPAVTDGETPPRAAIPAELVGDSNALTIRFADLEDCERIPRGTWNVLDEGTLEMQSEPLRLPNDLGILPLPFLDSHFDRDATVPVAFFAPVDGSSVKAASLVAAYFGVQGGSRLRFDVWQGDLPESSAVVLATRDQLPDFLRGAPRKGSVLWFRNHPRIPGGNEKLLILLADTTAELERVAAHLAVKSDEIGGAVVDVTEAPVPSRVQAYAAPRWLAPGVDVTFSEIEGGDALRRNPLTGGANTLRFRLAPDLFTWPQPVVTLDVHYEISVPADLPAPKIHVELDGQYLGVLPPPRRGYEGPQHKRLQIPTELLRGYNELSFHADFTAMGDLCATDATDEIKVAILPDSTLRLDGIPHFARMPDISTFVYDGFPFTRYADLSDTTVVLADEPLDSELSLTLSVMSHVAAVTGAAPTGLRVEPVSAVAPDLDRDLLIVSEGRHHPLAKSWAARLPVGDLGRDTVPQRPVTSNRLEELATGWTVPGELERAQRFVRGAEEGVSVAMGIESPLSKHRSAVVLAVPASSSTIPALRDFLGDAPAEQSRSDVLLATGEDRAMFQIGRGYDVGQIDAFRRLRWTLYHYWVALFPLLLLSAPLALVMHRNLQRRAERRLGGGSRSL